MTTDDGPMLDCPGCRTPAIPASGWSHAPPVPGPTWTEDDEGTCPGCGARVVVRIEDEYAEAELADEETDR